MPPAAPRLNPTVTPETLASTVCVSGWTTTVRRSFFTSQRMKGEMLKAIGGPNASTYVLDHIVPLCLGGSPNDPSNLQLQLWEESTRKDRVEVQACRCVCAGKVLLAEAQADLAGDWRAAYHKYAKMACRRGAP